MLTPEKGGNSESGIAIFGDHVPVYLSRQQWEFLKVGTSITIPLINHSMLNELKVDVFPQSNRGKGRTIVEGKTLNLSLCPTSLSSTGNEINIEPGGNRNYILRIEGWKDDVSDWEFAVKRAKKRLGLILDNKS